MSDIVKIENLKGMVIEIRGQDVLLDNDVAKIYGVETKRINGAVKNNPEKFPQDYLFVISKVEFADLPIQELRQRLLLKKASTCLLPY